MRIIDFHTHVYPDAIAPKAAQSVRNFYQLDGCSLDGTVSTLLEKGERAGIDRFVLLPVALTPERTRHINSYMVEQAAQQPRFLSFGTIHAGQDNLPEEVQYILDNGLKGIKMHTDSQGFPIDDPRLFPVYEMIQGQLPVLHHMGDRRYDHSSPARLRHILKLFPKLQVIGAHFGGYSVYEAAFEALKDAEFCYFDVSSSLMFMAPHMAEAYINHYGAERFVFGSDYPMWNPEQEVQRFLQLKLTGQQFQQIFHKTAESLLGLCPNA